ncbi:2-iminobutanoate/2-iminopropanoate deaminase [Geothermobacter ehrlichii]|uniref:2-iminobutanoate/2-iminopropanoate deaminase n=1 Tax=Geothermobacter ehrlichii TaxID=213224 RepID=A0A5D3WNC7_9BACT|nr:RidA family protein [Geothermobacter ehrlichii]TYP00082.1 2-iminobutanoate/2-iminopropanoate deaminase [Geothermobacter ehrlichii]
MGKEIFSTASAPAAIGPYSQAVRVGDLLFCSGQIPLVPETGEVVGEDLEAQAEQVMKNMGAVLAAAGLDYRHVVKTTIYMTDLSRFAEVNAIYGRYFPQQPPARATVEVSRLPKDVQIEIEWVASFQAG